MYCQKLKDKEVIELYSVTAKNHFPEAELKPVERVCSFLEDGRYLCYGLFEEAALLGYAFFLKPENADFLLLDYYAVMEEYRNRKLGSVFLGLLKEELAGQKESLITGFFIESENPDFAEGAEERDLRERRIGFYLRNGACLTEITSRLFGVDYRILYVAVRGTGLTEKEAREKLDYIYHAMFDETLFGRKVEITASLRKE